MALPHGLSKNFTAFFFSLYLIFRGIAFVDEVHDFADVLVGEIFVLNEWAVDERAVARAGQPADDAATLQPVLNGCCGSNYGAVSPHQLHGGTWQFRPCLEVIDLTSQCEGLLRSNATHSGEDDDDGDEVSLHFFFGCLFKRYCTWKRAYCGSTLRRISARP